MAANSLIVGLITYTASVVYNLLLQKSLKAVFYLGLRFLFYSTLTALFLQLGFYLIKNYNQTDDFEAEADSEAEVDNSSAEAEENMEAADFENQDFEESAVDNEFEKEEFSALNFE